MEDSKAFYAVNLLIRTMRMHKQLIDSNVGNIGIHRTQHRILMCISRNNKLASQKSLAEHIGVTPAAITCALKKLETDGYIRRLQASDNRYNEVEITEKGKSVVEETRALFSSIDKSLFVDFTEDEIDSFILYLGKIQKNIKASNFFVEENKIEKMG